MSSKRGRRSKRTKGKAGPISKSSAASAGSQSSVQSGIGGSTFDINMKGKDATPTSKKLKGKSKSSSDEVIILDDDEVKERGEKTAAEEDEESDFEMNDLNGKGRLWERKQLEDLNIRMDNLYQHYNTSKGGESTDRKSRQQWDDFYHTQLDKIKGDYQNKAKNWQNDYKKALTTIRNLENERDGLKLERDELQRKVNALEDNNNELSKAKDAAIRERDAKEVGYRVALDQLETDNANMKDEIGRLKAEIEDLRAAKKREMDRLQRELIEKFAKELQKTRDRWEDTKNQLIQSIKDDAAGKFKEFDREKDILNHQINELQKMLEEARKQIDAMIEENKKLRLDGEKERNGREQLQKKLGDLEAGKNKILDDLKNDHQKLQAEYNDLALEYFHVDGLRVQLQDEIARLSKKISDMEKAMGISSPVKPAKKRRRLVRAKPKLPVEIRSLKSPELENMENFPLQIREVDYATEYPGFEVFNQWFKSIKLIGFYFSNNDKSKRLGIPETVIPPHGRLRVCINCEKMNPNDLVWKGNLWDGKTHESLNLIDSNGNSLELLPVDPSQPIKKTKCLVM